SCKSLIKLEYHLEEVYKETTDQLDWVNPEGQQYPHNLLQPLPLIPDNRGRRVIPFAHFINNDLEYLQGEWHSYKHLDWITVRRDDDKLYKFKEGDFKRLCIQDIEDMLLLLIQGKLSNLTVEECFTFKRLSYDVYKKHRHPATCGRPSTRSTSSRKYTTSVTKTKSVDYGHIKWIEDLVPRTMWIQEPLNYDKHALWGVSHWGRKRQQFYGFAINRESALDVYSKRRIIAVTDLKIVKWHNYKHLDWILDVYKEYSHPTTYGRSSTESQKLPEEAQPNQARHDKKNRLMRIDELHKFSDVTLNDVYNALDDHLKGIRMQYLPRTIWRKGDKDRAAAMIQSIDKMLKTRRIMRSLERFIRGRLQTNPFAKAVSAIPGIVHQYMNQPMNEAVRVAVQIQINRLRDAFQKENDEFLQTVDENMKKIIKEQALVEAYEADNIILDTYRETVTLKRRRDDDADKEPESASAPSEMLPGALAGLQQGPDLDRCRPTYELMKGSCKSLIKLEYHLEEVYKETTDQLDWVNPEGQQYPHNLLQPLPLIPDNRGRRVIPFAH
nr:hypothetical protein [Tanacetum cinerariifolium]